MEDECCCGFLPCLCVTEEEAIQEKKLNALRTMLRTTTHPCEVCLMLPCLCDGDSLETEAPVFEDPTPQKKKLPTDEYGRVELQFENNMSNVWIASELEEVLKPHQKEGVEFLLRHTKDNQGCILADYMGLGKTIQLITTIHSFLVDGIPQGEKRTALVVCPTVCIMNWVQELQKWLTPESLEHCRIYQMETHNSYKSSTDARIQVLEKWKETGGVLIMGYEMFRLLLNPSRVVHDPSLDVVTNVSTGMFEISDKKLSKTDRQLRIVTSLLCSPGPDLVALDEGHRIKDPNSLLCISLEKLQTKRRIVLTGYPLQNSLSEYWCMVNFCRPNFLESYDAFRQAYERPILEGNVEVSKQLTQLLAPVVLRRGRQLLNAHLPKKREWILHCHLSSLQHQLYLDFLDREREQTKKWDLFTTYSTLLQIVNHPDVVYHRMIAGDENDNESNDDVEASNEWQPVLTSKPKPKKRKMPDPNVRANLKWAEAGINNTYDVGVLKHSGKMMVLHQLIQESQAAGDKVVVFSQSVSTLRCIGHFIEESKKSSDSNNSMKTSTRVQKNKLKQAYRLKAELAKKKASGKPAHLVIDGSISSAKRMEFINTFSDPKSGIDVLLVSTRAGAEGINLHAANRLVLFDVSWNPSHDHQSMCRSHRIGQTKDVFVYRFVSHDTMEEKIYDQQVKKVDLSSSIVDSATAQSTTSNTSSFYTPPNASVEDANVVIHEISGDEILDKCLKQVGKWVPMYFEAVNDIIDE